MSNDNNMQPIDPGGQLKLLPDSVTDEMLSKREHAQGIYSGDRLKHYDAARYELVCQLLAEGELSQRQISRIVGVSRNLVAGVSKSQSVDIEPLKTKIASQSRTLSQLCIERATELVLDDDAKVGLKDLMIAAGVGIDKSQLLSGQATSISEYRPADPSEDEFEAALRRAKTVDAEAEEIGFEGESSPAKGADVLPDSAGSAAPASDEDAAAGTDSAGPAAPSGDEDAEAGTDMEVQRD